MHFILQNGKIFWRKHLLEALQEKLFYKLVYAFRIKAFNS